MRTLPFRSVVDAVFRLLGLDPRTEGDSNAAIAITEHINYRVEAILLAWDWQEWNRTEERAFRQIWADDRNFLRVNADGEPDEVFYLGASFAPASGEFGTGYGYYRVLASAVADPPVGTVPTNTTYWEPIEVLDAYIDYDQVCQRAIGQVLGVYPWNPRQRRCCGSNLYCYRPSERGIDIGRARGSTAFVLYQMPIPRYTMIPHVVGRTYVRGEVVFDTDTGECFQAFTTTTNPPSDANAWTRVPFLSKWFNFVRYGAFADALGEIDQGGSIPPDQRAASAAQAEAKAMNALQQQIDSLVMQGERLQWSFKPRVRCWCESIAWTGGSVTTLTDACHADAGWVYPAPQSASGCDTLFHSEIVALLTADGTPSLEGLSTTNRTVTCTKITIVIDVGGAPEEQVWQLQPGTADPDDDGQLEPADYHVTTNAKFWEKVG